MQIERRAFISITRAIVCATWLVYFLGAPALAEEVKAGDLVITQAWSRATPGGAKVAGGYLTIDNKGSTPDRLIGGSADVADKVQVHEMTMNNGVMTMRVELPAIGRHPRRTLERPAEVRLRQARQRRQMREVN